MRERHGPLVSAETLWEHMGDDDWHVFDCRHDLMDPAAGPAAYRSGHLPGALHAHIDRDLSAPVGDGSLGRHPLPDRAAFEAFLRRSGVQGGDQLVAYDHGDGMWAARFWWLARYFGIVDVAVLDGGLARWTGLGLPTDLQVSTAAPGPGRVTLSEGHMPMRDPAATREGGLIDARAPERYRGDVEPIDPAAGHIPGAINLPFAGNIGPDGLFLSPDELRARFDGHGGSSTVYCGSGVTAAHNILAMEVAGLPTPALYPASWSGWCAQHGAVVTGPA